MKKIKLILLSSLSTVITPVFISSSCSTSKENNKVVNSNNPNDDVNVNPGSNVEIDSQNSDGDNQTTAPDLRAGGSGYNRNQPRRSKRLKDRNQNQETDSKIKKTEKAKKSKKADTKKKTKKQEEKQTSTTKDDKKSIKNNLTSHASSNKHKLRIASWNVL